MGQRLQRYESRFSVTEINNTFHRPHQPRVYERWANAVPADFRFCAKLPKTITHEQRLVNGESLVRQFLVRLHGSPRMYYSEYDSSVMVALAKRLRVAQAECDEAWCIFDNTASGAAMTNALQLVEALA